MCFYGMSYKVLTIAIEAFKTTLILMIFVFSGIGINILLKKNGEFAGTCASQNPFLNRNDEPCGMCGKLPKDQNCEIIDPQAN